MTIVYVTLAIIGIILVGIIAYYIGRNAVVQEKEVKYQQELAKKKQLIDEIKNKQEQLDRINEDYVYKQQLIRNAAETAKKESEVRETALEEKYKLKEEQLETKIKNDYEVLEARFNSNKLNYEERIGRLALELQSLKETKAATIAALEREAKIQEEKDSYRIVLSPAEENDIEILQDVRRKLENKRVLDMLIWQTFVRDKLKDKMLYIFPKKDMCGIYKITNLKNGKCYIGQARKLQDRINQHFKHGLYIDCPVGNKLYEAMQEDGIQNFAIELLEECDPVQLNVKEKYYISLYNAVDFGYNKLASAG